MSSREETIAVLGLGIIGSRVADRLTAAGRDVVAWSRSSRGRGDEVDSCREAVGSAGVICLFLKDGLAVREVLGNASNMMREGQIIVNHSTVDLATTRWAEEFCHERGCGFLDAPFTGSKVAAGNGELVYYVSGEADLIEELEPLLALSSSQRIFCGGVGKATIVKIATNLMSACAVQATSEAMALSVRHGVDPNIWLNAVAANANSSVLAMMKIPTILSGDYEPHFSLANMTKDGRYASELLDSVGVDAPALTAVLARMEQLGSEGLSDLDYSALAKPYFQG